MSGVLLTVGKRSVEGLYSLNGGQDPTPAVSRAGEVPDFMSSVAAHGAFQSLGTLRGRGGEVILCVLSPFFPKASVTGYMDKNCH